MKKNKITRKQLAIFIFITIICILSLSIAYSILNQILIVSGSSNVAASNWDVHIENIKIIPEDSNDNITITGPTSFTYATTLNIPGDKKTIEFDVVNAGTIDAEYGGSSTTGFTQYNSKYLTSTIKPKNEESMFTNRIVKAGESKTLNFILEYKKDISINDLPKTTQTANININISYRQTK